MTFSIVKSIECVLNRFVHRHSFGKFFKVTFLDVSPFNRREASELYLKSCQFGLPMVSYYCATQGLMQDEMDGMNFLEDQILKIKERFVPLQSSATQSAASSDEGGRPEQEVVTEEGERTREEA